MSKMIDYGAVIGAFSKSLNDVGALKQVDHCDHCGPTSWVNAPLEVVLDQLGGALVDVANGGEALDGAPEPEWEWGAMWPDSCIGEPSIWGNREESIRKEIEGSPGMHLVRRRKPDPWLPVEGESE